MSAPANRSPTETTAEPAPVCRLAWLAAFEIASAKRISTMEGGMIWPSVPDAAMVPVARRTS